MSRRRAIVDGAYVWLDEPPASPMQPHHWFHGSLVPATTVTYRSPSSLKRSAERAAKRKDVA